MSRHGAPPPPPSNPNVTCRACGCLNFSQREICDSCRSRAPVFRRTVRQSAAIREVGASSNGHLKASSVAPQRASQTNGGSDRRHAGSHGGRDERHSSSAGRKRRFGENGERSSAASAERSGSKATADSQQRRIPPTAKKQPEIIDLLSSSDDEAEDTAQVAASLDTSRSTAKTAATSRSRNERQRTTTGKAPTTSEAFQSRVFPSVEFVARDFPTVEVAAAARKASGQSGGQSVAVGVVDLTPSSSRPAETRPSTPAPATIRPPPAPRTPPAPPIAREAPVARAEPASQVPHTPFVRQAPPSSQTPQPPSSQTPQPPAVPKAPSSASTSSTASRQSMPVAVASPGQAEVPRAELFQSRRFEWRLFRESDFATAYAGLAVARRSHPPTPKATTPSSSATLTPAASAVATPPPIAISSAETAKPAATTAPPPPVTSTPTTTTSTPSTEMPVSAVVTPAPTTERTAPTSSTSRPVEAAPTPATANPTSAATNSVPAEAKGPVATKSATFVAAAMAVAVERQTASSKAQAAAAAATATPTATTPTRVVATGAAATPAVDSTSTTNPVRVTQPEASANVLLPKKKHPLGDAVKEEPQRSVSADTAAATNPAGSSAQTPARRVKAPLLGHCSADFLELMREFGDEDADDDPEEAQWALLDVVDLTSLSDSEGNDSDAESSISSPTNPLRQPVANAAEGAGQSTAVSTAGGSSTTSQHAPGPDAVPRQPYRPEKVDCELCGESGSANRLIRCPTCTKYYHRKCAREQGDATKCWNCELGMMIDDSDLTEEDKERQAEYTSAFRHYPTAEESGDDVGEEEGDVEMAEASVSSTPFSEATRTNKSNQRWKAFMEEDTADIDASFDAVTARITLELRTEEARNKYTKGFATREELDAQLAELEEFYIEEQERLERQRAKEKEKAMAAASASGNSEQREGGGAEAAGSSVREEGGDSEAVAPADASSNTGMTATSPSSSSLQVEAPPPVAPVPAAPPPSMSE